MKTERHHINHMDRVTSRYDRAMLSAETDMMNYKKNYHTLSFGGVSNYRFKKISEAVVLNRSKSEIYTHAYYALQFGINNYRLYYNQSREVEIFIGEDRFMDSRSGGKEYIETGTWQNLFCLAVILRHSYALDFLVSIPTDFLILDTMTYDELTLAYLEIMKGYNDPQRMKQQIAHYRDSEHRSGGTSMSNLRWNFHTHLSNPSVRLLELMIEGDNSQFNSFLDSALKLHMEFYGNQKQDFGMPNDTFGWLSYKLMWITALAFDGGMKLEVESAYLPDWMVRGDFEDCELTTK